MRTSSYRLAASPSFIHLVTAVFLESVSTTLVLSLCPRSLPAAHSESTLYHFG